MVMILAIIFEHGVTGCCTMLKYYNRLLVFMEFYVEIVERKNVLLAY